MRKFHALALMGAIIALGASLSGCAQYRQAAEAGANVALQDVQAADDDFAKAISIGPQAITLGAFARYPSGPQKCALATLAGVPLAGCTLTAADVQAIVSQQFTARFGAQTAAPSPTPAAPTATSAAAGQ